MRKFESKLDCHDFLVSFRSGSRAIELLKKEKKEENGRIDTSQFEKYYTKGEFKFIIFPKYKEDSR